MKNKIQSKNKTSIFILCLILLIAVVLIINYASFDRETKLEYKGQCDTNLHGIEIEGKCYNCGSSDNICPNDFGVNCKIKDPDCS